MAVQVNEFGGRYCSFAYSALASFRMGMSGSASFQNLQVTASYGFVSCRSTTSDSEWWRSKARLLPSGDQWNESI